MKWWLFWLALINRKIEHRYYKKRRQHLHRIYIRWEKEDPKEREAYRKWKPKEIEAFNRVWIETYKIDIPDSAKPKQKKHNKRKRGNENERLEQSNCKTVQNDGNQKKI